MGNALKKMEDEALKLPARSRARLAERLIASLEKVVDPEAESEWFQRWSGDPTKLVKLKAYLQIRY